VLAIFREALARSRWQLLGWGLALFLLGWPIVATYDVVLREQEKIAEVAQNFGPLIAGLGGDLANLASPANYLAMRYFSYLPLVVGVVVVLAGSGLLVADEEAGTLDLVLAHPVSRTSLFVGRWLAFVLVTLGILLLAWLGLLAPLGRSALPVGRAELARPFVSLLAVLLFFGNLALLLSLVLPSRRLAAATAGLALVASFFLTMLARMDQSLEPPARLSPLSYYQSGDALHGLNGRWLAGLLAAALLFAALAWWRFERRDIRVAGEGSWRWPWRGRKLVGPPTAGPTSCPPDASAAASCINGPPRR
jgi:ABC-2 type transport system permease protein